MRFALILCLALLVDSIAGDPKSFPHPVILIGKAITFFQAQLFTDTHSFIRGLALCVITLMVTALCAGFLLYVSGCHVIVQVYLLYSAVAWRDLKDETAPVFFSLMHNDLTNARKYLSLVVGRDTETLNASEITRAVIETIAENSIDGVMSVIFFAAAGYVIDSSYGAGVCVWLFKAASTLDSMVGYESFHEFGRPSARLDDVLNFIPARIGGVVITLAGRKGFGVFMRDRKKHKSPNSAHGESAFAGVLGVRLGGGAYYGGKYESRPFLNESGRDPEISDIVRAWRLLDVSCGMFAALVILLTCTI